LRFALEAMHEAVEHRWTVKSLASSAGMSRSGFAARFKELVGESPLEYLTRWRVYKATQLLRESDLKVAKIASLVGYESDAAFNRTFKKRIGESPGEYRKAFISRQSVRANSLPADHAMLPTIA
jgi:transcriptional regulator GlxA family with amidase domain